MNPPAPRKRILFVDDEASIRLTLPPVLEQAGFQLHVAETVSDALFEINSNSFDVLISDLNIGEEGDGFLVTTAMRQVQPGCLTFILTGYPAFETALQAIHREVDDYLVKPVDVETLVNTIRLKLAQRQAARGTGKSLSSILRGNVAMLMPAKSETLRPGEHESDLHGIVNSLIEALDDKRPILDPEILRSATEFGCKRRRQGRTPTMLAEEFRTFQEAVYAFIEKNVEVMDTKQLVRDLRRFQSGLTQLLANSMEALCKQDGPGST